MPGSPGTRRGGVRALPIPCHEADHAPEPSGGLGPLKEVALIGAAFAALCAALMIWARSGAGPAVSDDGRPAPDRNEPVAALFVGDKACAECHPGESAAHRRSGHSRTLRRAGDVSLASELDGKTVRDREFDATWQFALENGAFTASRTEQ